MRVYNFKASDSTGEMLMGLGFSFSFMGVAGLSREIGRASCRERV